MTIELEASRPASAIRVESTRAPRTIVPVKWWAALGGAFLALELYVWTRWVLSGNFKAVPTGADNVPTYMVIAARVNEVIGVGSFVLIMYFCVFRPWRRERRVPLMGVLGLASLTVIWQDMASSWSNHGTVFNTVFWNHGSWYNFIPGWIAPRAQYIPEPHGIDLVFPLYFAAPTLLFLWAMRKAKERFPAWGAVKLCGVAILVSTVLDIILEGLWLWTGAYSYPGTIPGLTLFAGHYYQFPVYELLLWGPWWAFAAMALYFCDDHGNSLVERGLEKLRIGDGTRVVVRVLALGAIMNVGGLGYTVGWGLMSIQPGAERPKDVVDRSYLTGKICGEGTGYACPGAGVPVPRGEDGTHMDPTGRFVVKPGPLYG